MAHHPHLMAPDAPPAERFTSPSTFISEGLSLPPRNRHAHAEQLVAKLEQLANLSSERAEEQLAFGVDDGRGIYLTFESEPQFELKFESLDVTRSGIELCAVKTTDRTLATVFVPDGKLPLFLKKVVAYRDESNHSICTTLRIQDKSGSVISGSGFGLVGDDAFDDVRFT